MKKTLLAFLIIILAYFVYAWIPNESTIVINPVKSNTLYRDTLFCKHIPFVNNFHTITIKGYVNDTIWYRLKSSYYKIYVVHKVDIKFGESEFLGQDFGTIELNTYKATQGQLKVMHNISAF